MKSEFKSAEKAVGDARCAEDRIEKIANAETIAAIEEGRRLAKDPNAKTYTSMEELWKALDI